MSKGVSDIYVSALRKQFNKCPNWEAHTPVALGDYGDMKDGIFMRIDNISRQFNIEILELPPQPAIRREFSSEGVKTQVVNVGAGTTDANAQIEISFEKENSVFFNAAECVIRKINNLGTILSELDKLYKQDKWNKDWVVITELEEATSAVVAISRESNASVAFEAASPVAKIDLADASLKLKASKQNKIAYKLDSTNTDAKLVVLLGMYKLKKKGFLGMGRETEWVAERSLDNHADSADLEWGEVIE